MNTQKETKPGKELPDEAIIELYWQRNEQAIAETDRKYGKYLFTIAYNIVHDRLDCEECVNDTYLGTWNRIPPQRPNVFQVFLSRIMRNIAIDKFRKNTAKKQVPSEMLVSLDELEDCMPTVTPEEEQRVTEISRVLNTFLRELNARSEFIFICRYYYSDSVAKIAKMLGLSDKTVYRELSQIRKQLKERLAKEGLYHEA